MNGALESGPGVSVVLAAFNEESAVAETVTAIRQALSDAGLPPWEVLVVDDGSTDGTRAAAEAAGARVIGHPHNAGYGRSLKDGIRAALHDTVVICDADATYPATAIPVLFTKYRQGFDMVVGQRTRFRDGLTKGVLRHFLKWLVEYSAGQSIPDINSGLRVFDRRAVLPHFRTLCNTFSFTTSLTLAFMMTGRFVSYVPISYAARTGPTKVRLLRDTLRTLQYIVEALVYYNPLKVFLLPTVAFGLLSVAGFTLWLIRSSPAAFASGWCALALALISFFFGLLAVRLRFTRED
jgi:glycosyltransferase involved in cell wall biosynthesis